MKVISKNCTKPVNKNKKRKSMAELGANAYLSTKPQTPIEAIQSSIPKKQESYTRY